MKFRIIHDPNKARYYLHKKTLFWWSSVYTFGQSEQDCYYDSQEEAEADAIKYAMDKRQHIDPYKVKEMDL